MGLFSKTGKKARDLGERLDLATVIENRAPVGYICYRHPEENFNTKSILTVNPGEQAVFVNNGKLVQVFRDPGKYQLKTSLYPFLKDLQSIATGGKDAFSCQIYFVRTVISEQIEYGGNVEVRDPGLGTPRKVFFNYGYRLRINDGGRFLTQLFRNGRTGITAAELPSYFEAEILSHAASSLSANIQSSGAEVVGIDRHIADFSRIVQNDLNSFLDSYGLQADNFSFSRLKLDKNKMAEEAERLRLQGMMLNAMGQDAYKTIRGMDVAQSAAENTGGNAGNVLVGINALQAATGAVLGGGANRDGGTNQDGKAAFCPGCGKKAAPGDAFCSGCGRKL